MAYETHSARIFVQLRRADRSAEASLFRESSGGTSAGEVGTKGSPTLLMVQRGGASAKLR